MEERSFSPALFSFLSELRQHNDRDWFNAHKPRYVEAVQEPALEFIADFEPHLRRISPHMVADARTVGGSLFRIYRDVRFSKDKSPYKTHSGIQFRHEMGKDVHAPVFYLHLQPGSVFAAAGLWRPDGGTVAMVRDAISSGPDRWRRITKGKRFGDVFHLEGESLKRAPAGYDPKHPLVEDLKRKDFIAVAPLGERDVTSPGFLKAYAGTCRAAAPFMRFLCDAIGVPF